MDIVFTRLFLRNLANLPLPLQIRIGINIIQHGLSSLRRLDPQLLDHSRLPLGLPCHPPRHTSNHDTSTQHRHGNRKRRCIVWRILGLEDLWTDSTADLTVAVDEPDCEGGTRSTRSGLDSPRPHHRVPALSERVGKHSRRIHCAITREGV